MPHRNRERENDWARQVPRGRRRGPYRDYGWEANQSALPQFRDPDVSIQPYERERMERWHNVQWDEEHNRGRWDVPGPYSGVGPKNYRRTDERIFEDACETLTRHGKIDAREINVDVKDGEVILKGSVHDRKMRNMAEDAVNRLYGVKDVRNELRLKEQRADQGFPGGGKGRIDRVGQSGVYPASGNDAPDDAEAHGMASWGQGERGAAGYEDSGESELNLGDQSVRRRRE